MTTRDESTLSPLAHSVTFAATTTTQVIPKDTEKIVRYDVRFNVSPVKCPAYTTSHVWATIVTVVKKLQEIDPQLLILSWNTDRDPSPLNIDEAIGPIESLHRYFPRIASKSNGTVWSEARISHHLQWDTIKIQMLPWLQKITHGIYLRTLQVESTRVLGWLLYSHRAINAATLSESFFQKYNYRIAFRFQNISMGRDTPPDSEVVRPLHIIAPFEDLEAVKTILQQVYHTKAKSFPLGIRMRFVPWIVFSNQLRVQQVMELRNRKAVFINSVTHMASWENMVLDKKSQDMDSLRDMIMKLKSKQYPTIPLFLSVDQTWNNPAIHVFSFLPRVETEFRQMITTLLPYLKHKVSTHVETYFTNPAIQRTAGTIWDEATDQVVTIDEQYFSNVHATIGDNDDWFGLTILSVPNAPMVNITPIGSRNNTRAARVQNIFYGDVKDSVGIVRTGASGAARPFAGDVIITDENSHGCTGISISGTDVETRVSSME
jgi:hypothetical protein